MRGIHFILMLLPTPSSNVLFCDKSTSKGISWQFVRSYRDKAGLPKQRVLASLGLANLPLKELQPMAKAIERALLDRASLFSDEIEPIHLLDHGCLLGRSRLSPDCSR